MANIIQAAQWMKEGKLVRRNSSPPQQVVGDGWRSSLADAVRMHDTGLIQASNPEKYSFPFVAVFVDSLLAEDWESVEATNV